MASPWVLIPQSWIEHSLQEKFRRQRRPFSQSHEVHTHHKEKRDRSDTFLPIQRFPRSPAFLRLKRNHITSLTTILAHSTTKIYTTIPDFTSSIIHTPHYNRTQHTSAQRSTHRPYTIYCVPFPRRRREVVTEPDYF
jgi:hypothetical protein